MSILISALFVALLGWIVTGPMAVPAGWVIARDAGRSPWLALLLLIPYAGLVAFALMLPRPERQPRPQATQNFAVGHHEFS